MARVSRTMAIAEKIQKLRLFNEKIEMMRRGRFASLVSRSDHGVTLSISSEAPMAIERRGADEDSTLALAATLRFFVQPKDGITLLQIADLYETLPIEERAKTSARAAAEANGVFLDRLCEFGLNGETFTNREIFEVAGYPLDSGGPNI